MERDPNEKGGGGGFMVLAACGMVLCCALPLLLTSGALSAAGAGLFDGGLGWWLLAGVFVLAAGGLMLRNRSRAGGRAQFPGSNSRQTHVRGMNEIEQPRAKRAPEAAE